MPNDRILSFALVHDGDVVDIVGDSTGMPDLIVWLKTLETVADLPASLHWKTSVLGGAELTDEKQRADHEIIHDVKVILAPYETAPGDDYILTFEMTADWRQLQIHCNPDGLKQMIHTLSRLSEDKDKPDHDHWMTQSWAGHELTERKKGGGTILINQVDVRYWP